MVVGGKYNILSIINDYINDVNTVRFTTKELAERTEFCQQAVSANITRLVRSGFLIKHEYYSRKKKCQVVEYSINPEANNIIKELFE